MTNFFHLDIYTPQKIYYQKDVNSLSLITDEGQVTILAHHADYIANVLISHIVINENGHINYYATSGGVVNVYQKDNKVILVLETIEEKNEIDVSRATKAKENAEIRLKEKLSNREQAKAEIKLKRALNRISLYNRDK